MKQPQLWHNILNFPFDDSSAERPFSLRLSQENDWSYEFSLEAIHEYRKFMYLATIADQAVGPSKVIDQVWHLHLIYTRSYWFHFCEGILGRSIHHAPSKGGGVEDEKHRLIYRYTLELYAQEFKEEAPMAIWGNAKALLSKGNPKNLNTKNQRLISLLWKSKK